MVGKRVELRLSAQLLQYIDQAAKANLMTRSDFIRESVIIRLNGQQITRKSGLEDFLGLLRRAG